MVVEVPVSCEQLLKLELWKAAEAAVIMKPSVGDLTAWFMRWELRKAAAGMKVWYPHIGSTDSIVGVVGTVGMCCSCCMDTL
jgi:hypothetical protein